LDYHQGITTNRAPGPSIYSKLTWKGMHHEYWAWLEFLHQEITPLKSRAKTYHGGILKQSRKHKPEQCYHRQGRHMSQECLKLLPLGEPPSRVCEVGPVSKRYLSSCTSGKKGYGSEPRHQSFNHGRQLCVRRILGHHI